MKNWQTKEFSKAITILLHEKPFDKSITKAVEELNELSVKLLQLINKPKSIKPYDIQEEIVDVEMHLVLLKRLFSVPNEVRTEKINKFLQSKEFKQYKKQYNEKLQIRKTTKR